MAICEKCIKKSVCKLCDGSEIMVCKFLVVSSELEKNSKKLEKATPKNDLGVDLISRADVLKLMQDNWHTHDGDWAMQESLDDIRALLSVTTQEPRWIPVSERLPEIHRDVILSLRSLDIEVGFRAETEPYFYCHGADGCYIEPQNVLAWQPLPEPYNAESEEY